MKLHIQGQHSRFIPTITPCVEVGMAPKGRRPPATQRVPERPHGAPHDPTDAPNGPRRVMKYEHLKKMGSTFHKKPFIILDLCTCIYRYIFVLLCIVI